jgi:ATP-dependent Clp protease ATP-binding subunit ClpA
VSFSPLPPDVVTLVVDKFIMQLEAQLEDRGVTFELDGGARDWLVREGYDEQFGARPMARVIQEHIKKPLADELLFGKLENGGIVKISVSDGKLLLNIKTASSGKSVRGKPKGESVTA